MWLEDREQKTSRENGDEAKRNEGCADKKVVCGITNVRDGAILLTAVGMKVVCVCEWKGEE